MQLEEFNAAEAEQLREELATCAPIASWGSGLLARRPYRSRDELLSTAAELAEDWTDLEVDAALAHHPRIGEKAAGDSAEARASRAEQGTLSEDDAAREEWLNANKAYEEKFDRIFLIRAKGRSPQEMLEQLQSRLQNSDDAEARIRREQLAEIALLRLKDLL